MTVTVDINVLLEVFQHRNPHYAASAQVVSLVAAGNLTGVCPAHGLTILYYLIRKLAAKTDAEAALDRVLEHFQIGNLDTVGWRAARNLSVADFEDAVVATVAASTGSVFIITRDVSDFQGTTVPAVSPGDFLEQFALLG